MRSVNFLFALGLLFGSSSDAALLVYNFDSADLGLHGEITFEDTNPNFAANSTVTLANGGVVDFFFEQGSSYWNNDDGTSAFSLSFGAGGTSPDDINFYGWNALDTVAPGGTGAQLSFNTDFTTNGNHSSGVSDVGGLVFATDGTFSVDSANVPEPASLWLLSGVAVCGLSKLRRQRRKSTEPISSESL